MARKRKYKRAKDGKFASSGSEGGGSGSKPKSSSKKKPVKKKDPKRVFGSRKGKDNGTKTSQGLYATSTKRKYNTSPKEKRRRELLARAKKQTAGQKANPFKKKRKKKRKS